MNTSAKTRFHLVSYKDYFCIALAIIIIFLSACSLKHIYPFGNQYLINFTDFKAQSVPIYMHLWDALHGNADVFFDWRFGLGSNFSGTISHYSLFSPFSLFFLFIKRESIMPSMTWYILLKLVCMGLTMAVFLKNDPVFFEDKKLSSSWVILGSVTYALNGYTMQYYGFPWLDIGVFLPVLLLHLDHLLISKSIQVKAHEVLYALFLALILIINIPQAYATCLFILGYACGYLFIVCPDKEVRRYASVKLILFTIIGLMLSMFIFLPAAYHISHSYRMQYGNYTSFLQSYITMMDLPKQDVSRKWNILLGVIVPLGIAAVALLKSLFKKSLTSEKKYQVYLLLLVIAPVLFESVNGVYHNGPYSMYPMRYGFLTSFTIIVVGLCNIDSLNIKESFKRVSSTLIRICWIAVIIFFTITGIEGSDSYDYHQYLSAVTSIDNDDVLERVKLTDSSMLENYPLYLNVSSLSNYVPLNSYELITFVQNMGYAQDWVRLEDAGGTLFSDALLNIKYNINTVSDGLYHRDETTLDLYRTIDIPDESITISETNLNIPSVYFISENKFDTFTNTYGNTPFSSQNNLSELLFNQSLIYEENGIIENQNKVVIPVHTSGNEALYFWSDDLENITLQFDGTIVNIPGRNALDNAVYPVSGNNGIIPLGSYSTGEHTLSVSSSDAVSGNYSIGHLKLDSFQSALNNQPDITDVVYSNNSLSCTYTSGTDGYLLFPLYADQGWNCIVNNTKTDIKTIYGTLMVFPVTKGENTIQLTYTPPYLTAGIILSIFAVAILLIVYFSYRKEKFTKIKKTGNFFRNSLHVIWIIYLFYVYIIPVLFRIGMSLYKRLF